jgi:hypothetical protein
MNTGIDAIGWSTRSDQKRFQSTVNSRGAVSPEARASASRQEVTMPAEAAGMTTSCVVRQRGDHA